MDCDFSPFSSSFDSFYNAQSNLLFVYLLVGTCVLKSPSTFLILKGLVGRLERGRGVRMTTMTVF